MLPSQKEFYNQVARIGVKPTDLVIAYDGVNFYTIFKCKKKIYKNFSWVYFQQPDAGGCLKSWVGIWKKLEY